MKFLPFVKPLEQHSKEASEVIEASSTFSAFEGSLRSLFVFLFSVKQWVPTAAVILGTFAYELVHELAVSHLCTVRVAYMVYLARLRTALHFWLACIFLQHGGVRYSPRNR